MRRLFTPSLLVLCLVAVSVLPAVAQSLFDRPWMVQATPAAVQALLDGGTAVNARDEHGAAPLHFAASNANPAVVALLLDRGGGGKCANRVGRDAFAFGGGVQRESGGGGAAAGPGGSGECAGRAGPDALA